ncbi:hypothetical protein [Nocardia sp. NPDC059239]
MKLNSESSDFGEQRPDLFCNLKRTTAVFSDDYDSEDEPDEPDCN